MWSAHQPSLRVHAMDLCLPACRTPSPLSLYRQAVKLVKQQQPLCGDVSSDKRIEQKLRQVIQALSDRVKEGETGVLSSSCSWWLRIILSFYGRRPVTAVIKIACPVLPSVLLIICTAAQLPLASAARRILHITHHCARLCHTSVRPDPAAARRSCPCFAAVISGWLQP
jgi:hypothetical protein